ncbi:MAG TPA: hypothetical protein PLF30_04370 [Candidatus Moranbacteria bacterium]|jgi:glutaredoxin|nr:hypothetical protein [Candidatus Moranbacteria bacterium]HOF42560.1 hypothetical protein [Candidatus Moranbacteria bacterium]HPX94761.1 hypothetical protein [Candidatus Moranbacteria bacterium]HQB59603.1 hypothetical protein [Candidatus Moranbacteria bacterium]
MKNKIIIPTVLFIFTLIFSFYAFFKDKSSEQLPASEMPVQEKVESEENIIFFYGDGCPHCLIVEDYIKKNKVDEKIKFSQKEIYRDRANFKQLEEKARACGIPKDSIGIPFLWDGEKCLSGDKDIIAFFKQKIYEK